jgi:hypothetical protein
MKTSGTVMKALQRCGWAIGLAFGLMAGTVQAAVHFGFSVDFISGPLSGQTAIGSIEVANADCPAWVCNGSFTASGPSNGIIGPTGTLLGFEIVVDGTTFTAASDSLYPDFPIFTFADNVLTGIDFNSFGLVSLSIFANAFGGPLTGGGSYTDANFDTSLIGNIQQLDVPLPEPATALLMGLALLTGFSTTRRRSPR